MSFKSEDRLGQDDEHFSKEDGSGFFEALEKGELSELESKFYVFFSKAEAKVEKFITSALESNVSEDVKKQIEEVSAGMKDEFSKIKKWFSDKIAEVKSKPDDTKTKINAFKEEFLKKWTDFKKFISDKTKYIRNLAPGAKKPAINAEAIIKKAKTVTNDIILPKLKEFYAISKAAAAGAVKGVKEMNKNKDESEKK